MNTTIKERKAKAIELMNQLDIYKPYINGFKSKNNVCYFERFGGFWAFQDPELTQKIKEVEQEYNCTVYAITHEYAEFGECYSFLVVTDYKEEWDTLIEKESSNNYYAFAYVWNKTDSDFSEFGTICVKSFGGGIMRIA